MSVTSLLIANRGEIAIRIARAASELGIRTVSIHSEDDDRSLHIRKTDETRALSGTGPAPYLDIAQIIAAAQDAGCDAIHPGYGFLAENAAFAEAAEAAGITFVGPRPATLALFGDKTHARSLAARCEVPLLRGIDQPVTLEEAADFLAAVGESGGIMLKAVAGGGGRGTRPVTSAAELDKAYKRCQSEARAAFGNGDLYVEQFLPRARHLEVQIVGDGRGAVSHLWERECSLQRRFQKIVEIAPSPTISDRLRTRLTESAVRMAREDNYRSLGTFEFLVDAEDEENLYFIEANARLQVEHTVTEEITGVDLVKAQLRLAAGATLAEVGLDQDNVPAPRGYAIQARVNLETMAKDGSPRPSGGTLTAFDLPSGPGVRVDTFGYTGYTTSPRYDSLLAKVIAYSPSSSYEEATARAYRALSEFRIEGPSTNIPFLQALLQHPDVIANRVHTRFVEEHSAALIAPENNGHRRLFFEPAAEEAPTAAVAEARKLAGARVDARDPLAVLTYGRRAEETPTAPVVIPAGDTPEGTVAVRAPMQGTVISIDVAEGDQVGAGRQLLVMEAMKMEHVITATASGVVRTIGVEVGDAVFEGHSLVLIEEQEVDASELAAGDEVDLDHIRPDLQLINERHALTLDDARPEAVERRRKTKQRTARENIADLIDDGSFAEYGSLVIAAPHGGMTRDELIRRTPTDGFITGIASVNGDQFDEEQARCAILSYDYTVLAGTQGAFNHRKHDRMFELAAEWRIPLVIFTEGGGGRGSAGGESSGGNLPAVAGLRGTTTFRLFGKLSGLVPLVGINSGRCFAGNAALLGCCDVVIATENSTIGMGGPAMIEGGGLGVFRPEEVGPMSVQVPNGVVDIAVADEAEAVAAAKKYLSYFQGRVRDWESADQRRLRQIIPENRLRAYDVRQVIETMADTDSVLELRRHFGLSMITAFARIEGRPVGIIANNPAHLAGAIDSDAADKASRFMQLCDAFDIPLVSLCDTPGIMVGPEVEKTALVRHASRLFVTASNITVPLLTIVLRKAYGLGAMAMAGGTFGAPFFAVSWPTGEFGGMGLEGQVKLGQRKQLEAIEDPAERLAYYEQSVARLYERGKAINSAVGFEIDDVIDPAETRFWISTALRATPTPLPREGKKRAAVDTW